MNLVKGTKIWVSEPVFTGSFRKPKYAGQREYAAIIVNDSYGSTGQHTFTIEVSEVSGVHADKMPKKTTRKGRNLYPNIVKYELPADYDQQAESKRARSDFSKAVLATEGRVYA